MFAFFTAKDARKTVEDKKNEFADCSPYLLAIENRAKKGYSDVRFECVPDIISDVVRLKLKDLGYKVSYNRNYMTMEVSW